MKKNLRFIDLFAGLGGFHLALHELGHNCVFASELDNELRELYKLNHNVLNPDKNIRGNIHQVAVNEIPAHDILCAGFPCQPFSQAGKRKGLNDPVNGNHFSKIIEILKYHKPKYVLLENVPNLKGHDNGETWLTIKKQLKDVGYYIDFKILSPHEFGIPQHRKRIYIVGRLNGLNGFKFPNPKNNSKLNIFEFFDKIKNSCPILVGEKTKNHIEVWQNFLDILSKNNIEVPRFPVWSTEFGATYPYEDRTPINLKIKDFNSFRGVFGKPLKAKSLNEIHKRLPKYALSNQEKFPVWKRKYIGKNRSFYEKNEVHLKPWLKEVENLDLSHQKFEWNCGFVPLEIKDKIIQFRPSGIRIKNPDFTPALVLSQTQIPIIFDRSIDDFRYISFKEAALLQKMESIKNFPQETSARFKAFGNAVNVEVVKEIFKKL